MREWWDYGSRSAGRGRAEWGNWHSVDCSIEIVPSQVTRLCEIDRRVGKSSSGENRPRDLPSSYQVIGAAAVEHGLYRELPHIVCIQGVTNIVICRSVAASQIKGVLGVDGTACREFGEAAVRNFIQSMAIGVVYLEQTIAETSKSPPKRNDHPVIVRNSGCRVFSDPTKPRIGTGRNGWTGTGCGREWTPSESIG